MQPTRDIAGADIPFPLIKETRPQPLRDAEALSTQTDESEVQHMNGRLYPGEPSVHRMCCELQNHNGQLQGS